MSLKRNLMPAFVFLTLAFLTAGLSHAQGNPGIEVIQAGVETQALVPEIDSCQEEETMTLEEIQSIFGAKNVCGARCGGWPPVNCSNVCGDAASCRSGYCIYL